MGWLKNNFNKTSPKKNLFNKNLVESLHLANFSAKEIEKLADYKNTVGLLNKIEDK